MTDHSVDPELLLEQTGWLQRLARQLVADPGLADDAVQETLVTALERPPRGASEAPVLRSWLKAVLQGTVRRQGRSARRRTRREEEAAREEVRGDADAGVLVGRAESAQLLVSVVHELPEPHRAMLLLRYFEGLAPAEIATELGLRPEAVRQRLMRARDALRERLDRRHGGDRRAWLGALAPLAGVPKNVALRSAATGPTVSTFTSLTMIKLALVAASLAAVSTLLLSRPASQVDSLDVAKAADALPTADAPTPSAPETSEPAARSAVPEEASPAPREHDAVGADGLFRPLLTGRVTDADGAPIAGARVAATWGYHNDDGGPSLDATTAEDGRYELVLPARAWLSEHAAFPGRDENIASRMRLLLLCTADGYEQSGSWDEYPHDEPATVEASFELTYVGDAKGVHVRVVDATGAPVSGAGVALFDVRTGRICEEDDTYYWLVTRSNGWARFDRRPSVPTIPFAMTQAGLTARGPELETGPEPRVEVTLRASERVSLQGIVRDAAGIPVRNARIELLRSDGEPSESEWKSVRHARNLSGLTRPWIRIEEKACLVQCDVDGRFRVGHLALGDYWARLEDDSVHGPLMLGSTVDLELTDRTTVFVRAIDHAGRVLRGAELVVFNGRTAYGKRRADRLNYHAFRAPPGRWRVAAKHGAGGTAWREIELPRDAGERVELVIDYSVAPVPVELRTTLAGDGSTTAARLRVQRLLTDPKLYAERNWLEENTPDLEHDAADGTWSTELRPGRYRVTAWPPKESEGMRLPTSIELDVEEEPVELELPLEQGGRLRFRWSGSLASGDATRTRLTARFRRPTDERPFESTSSTRGVLVAGDEIEHVGGYEPLGPGHGLEQAGPLLPPGDYVLRLEGDDVLPVERTVRIEAGAETIVDVPVEPVH